MLCTHEKTPTAVSTIKNNKTLPSVFISIVSQTKLVSAALKQLPLAHNSMKQLPLLWLAPVCSPLVSAMFTAHCFYLTTDRQTDPLQSRTETELDYSPSTYGVQMVLWWCTYTSLSISLLIACWHSSMTYVLGFSVQVSTTIDTAFALFWGLVCLCTAKLVQQLYFCVCFYLGYWI